MFYTLYLLLSTKKMNRINSMAIKLLLIALSIISCKNKTDNQNLNIDVEPKSNKIVTLIRHDSDRKVDVLINDKLFTSYVYPNNIKKQPMIHLKISIIGISFKAATL